MLANILLTFKSISYVQIAVAMNNCLRGLTLFQKHVTRTNVFSYWLFK